MSRSERRFAELLTEGVHRIRIHESKTVQIVQDELGYALGRQGGSAIEYWRKGHIPPTLADIEQLAQEVTTRGHMERGWLEQFLRSADHPYPARLCDTLFPPTAQPEARLATSGGDSGPPPTQPDTSREYNPFVVGLPVMHPRQFFGRTFELRRIFGLWRRFPLQNVAVIGPKRSGKTSLLHYLKNVASLPRVELPPDRQAEWLPPPGQFQWVYVDFQDARLCQLEGLARHILTNLGMPVPQPCDLYGFLDTISLHLKRPTVILLDEIGAALASAGLDQQFWWSLRSLGSHQTGGNLAFLLAAHDLPAQLAEEENKPSPFFNIFGHTFTLGPFTEVESRSLIANAPEPFSDADADWILAQSQGWPALVQVLCHARLTALEYNEAGDQWQQAGLQQLSQYRHLLG